MIRVQLPGLMSTIQDRGRCGRQHLGVTPGGAMDRYSATMANVLVNNAPDAAVLEMTLQGPSLRFETGTWIALTGAHLSPSIDGSAVSTWRPVWIPGGSCLNFGQPRLGCRSYLAVAGGFALPAVLGSRSTDRRGGFGGLQGRSLQTGDVLNLAATTLPTPDNATRLHAPTWYVDWREILPLGDSARLRLILGSDWHTLPMAAQGALLGGGYRVSALSDRMGLRLEGPSMIRVPVVYEKLSVGVTFGTLQLPPDGQPILLGVDRQTTGGYPVLGTVASVDHPRLAQLRPGDRVHFELITVDQAQALYRTQAERLSQLLASLSLRWPLNKSASPQPCLNRNTP